MQKTTEEIYGIKLEEIDPSTPSTSPYMPDYLTMQITWHTKIGFNWGWYFTNWRDECMAWHETCTLSTNINPGPACIVKGPDAKKFLQKYLVNNFDNFPINTSKHGIMCIEDGTMISNGVLMRIEEDAYELHWLSPFINAKFEEEKGNYDATLEDITAKHFIFQMSGPKSLEIVEDVTNEDLHHMTFNKIYYSKINGKNVRVLRFGMTGGLGYEIHGNSEDAKEIHLEIMKAGNPYGLHLLGIQAYMMNHTLGGSIQFSAHYSAPLLSDPIYGGSAGHVSEKLYFNPYEMGLGRIINYDHDFVGKEALLKYRDNQKKTTVSLVWNAEDIGEIYASQFRTGEEPYCPILTTGPAQLIDGAIRQEFDFVYDKNGREIGISSGRTMSPYHNAMVSLATIDLEYTKIGTEVEVLWGDPGTRQKKVRAIVAPMPYNTHYSNKTFDVNSIPRLKDRKK